MGTLQKTIQIMNYLTKRKIFDRVLDKIKIVSAEPGKIVGELVVEEEHQNGGGTLHGGLTATIVDSLTTFTLLSYEGGQPGVSVNLNMTYMAPANTGDLVTITAECLKMGRTMAFTTAELKLQDGTVIARGNHTKHLGGSRKS